MGNLIQSEKPTIQEIRKAVRHLKKYAIKGDSYVLPILNKPLFKKMLKKGLLKEIKPGLFDFVMDK